MSGGRARVLLSLALLLLTFFAGVMAGLEGDGASSSRGGEPAGPRPHTALRPAPTPSSEPPSAAPPIDRTAPSAAAPVDLAGAVTVSSDPLSASSAGRGSAGASLETLSDDVSKYPVADKIAGLTRSSRFEALPPDRVVVALGVRPGMTVVDVGAGSGYLTFALLAALKGQGRLFATDIDARMLDHLRRRARALGHPNLTAVQVAPGGLDPFYGRHVFDLVVLSSVLEYLPDPVGFLRGLRSSLRPGSGRLAIIQGLPDGGFVSSQFGADFQPARLLAEGPAFPVVRRLPASLRRALRDLSPDEILAGPERDQMARAFNAMVADPRFVSALLAHGQRGRKGPPTVPAEALARDVPLARWLYHRLDQSGAFVTAADALEPDQRAGLVKLGAILLSPFFKAGHRSVKFYFPRALYLSNRSVVARMARAGYVLVREISTFRGHAFLIFRRSERRDQGPVGLRGAGGSGVQRDRGRGEIRGAA